MTTRTRPARPGEHPPRLLLLGLWGLALALAAELTWTTLVSLYGKKGADFVLVVYEAAQAVPRGGQLYDVQRVARDLFGPSFHLPPFAALVAVPFGLLPEDPALEAWRALSLAAHFGALALLLRTLGVPPTSPLAPLALALWAFWWPARFTFIAGQWDAFFLLALAAAWSAARRRGLLAGGLIALAASVKPYPVLALGYFAARRQWGAVLGGLAGLAACFGLAWALVGPRQTQIFLEKVVPHLGATTAYVENQSLTGFLARLLEPEMRPLPTEAPAVYLLSRLLLLPLLAMVGLLGLRAARAALGADLQYAAFVALIPIVIPVAWMHYQELLLLPFLVLAAAWWREPGLRPGRVQLALYLLALVLVAFGDHYTVLGSTAGELWKRDAGRVEAANDELLARFAGPAVLLLSYKLYGALLLWSLCLRTAWRATAWEARPANWYTFLLGRQEAGRPLAPAGERKVQTAQSRVPDASRGRVTGS